MMLGTVFDVGVRAGTRTKIPGSLYVMCTHLVQ